MARGRGESKAARASTRGEVTRSRSTNGAVPDAIRSTMAGVEALSVGAVNILAGTVISARRGIQEIGGELGTTALGAFRGSIRAAGEIGGERSGVARGMSRGAMTAGRAGRGVGRGLVHLAGEAADGAMYAAHRIASAATRAARGVVEEVAARASGSSITNSRQP